MRRSAEVANASWKRPILARVNESEFNRLADAELARVAQAFDDSGIDCDTGFKGEGVLEVEFADGAKLVINRHAAAQQIWVADRSGGFHFRCEAGRWVGTRDGRELMELLGQLASAHSGQPTQLGRAT
jgi:CyaY protein